MPKQSGVIATHIIDGGWATDRGVLARVGISQDGTVAVPFLRRAENIVYELNGAARKVGGTTSLNSSAVNGGTAIRGLFDYWKMGVGGAPTQRRVLHTGTLIMADNGAGSFSNIFTGMSDNSVPQYNVFEDSLIIASDSNEDVPKTWDQTTAADLGGSPPKFSFSVTHQNRVWAAGVEPHPSRLYYSDLLDAAVWNGDGNSGQIDIDPSDGDRITGLFSYRNALFVFKGPNTGSIHRIDGSSPVGSDGFRRTPFVRGVGAVAQNLIFGFENDVGFVWSDGGVYSLRATDAYGDLNEAALSRDISSFIIGNVDFSILHRGWAVNDRINGYVLMLYPKSGAADTFHTLMMDYRFDPVRWAIWPAISVRCLARVVDTSAVDLPIIMAGGTDGVVRRLGRNKSTVDTTNIVTEIAFPNLDYGTPKNKKLISDVGIGIDPKNSNDMTFRWRRDDQSIQETSISQSDTQTLGHHIVSIADGGGAPNEVIITGEANVSMPSVADDVTITGSTVGYNGTYSVTQVDAGGSGVDFSVESAFLGTDTGAWTVGSTTGTTDTRKQFILGVSKLSGERFLNRWVDLVGGGDFRSIRMELSHTLGDLELHSITTRIHPGADSGEN
jgi:hypothetical protein